MSEYKEALEAISEVERFSKITDSNKLEVGADPLKVIKKALRIADAVERNVNHYLSHIEKTYKDDDLTDYETVKFLLSNILKEAQND